MKLNKDIYSIASRYAEFLVYHLGFEDACLYSEVLHSNLMSKRDCVIASIKQSQKDFEDLKSNSKSVGNKFVSSDYQKFVYDCLSKVE